jgi:cell division protease FtsH
MTRSEMIGRLVFAMGGRSAEELVFHEPTTGASSDIDQATKIARAMVTEYGMSARLGAVRYGREQGDPFLGRSMGNQADYSLEVAHEIDEEVRKLIEAAHTEAWEILNTYRDVLDELVFELLEKETLTRRDLERIFGSVQKRPRITAFNDFGGRTPSDKPPIQTPAERARERGEPWPPAREPEREPTPVGSFPGGANGFPRPARTAVRAADPGPAGRLPGRWPRPVPGHPAADLGHPASRSSRPRGAAQLRCPAGLASGHHAGRPVLAAAGAALAAAGTHLEPAEHGPGNGHVDGHVDDHAGPHPGATPPAVPPVPDAAPPARPADPTVEPPTGNGSHPREDGSR